MSEISDKILEARELMNNRGKHWLRGAFRSKNPKTGEVSFCSVGAVREVGGRGINARVYHYLHEALPPEFQAKPYYGRTKVVASQKSNAIIAFNDRYGRKWGEVSKLFRKAAKLAEKDAA